MNGWISVKEKLPEPYNQVLCYGEEPNTTRDYGFPYKTGIYDGKDWFPDHFCESSWISVTHWMPLPEHPGKK